MLERIIGGALITTTLLAGCEGTPNQVNGVNVVDCTSGPKIGETTINLNRGSILKIGGWDGKSGNDVSSIRIESEGGDSLSITNWNHDKDVKYLLRPDAQLPNNDVGVFADSGIIYVNSEGINYYISKTDSSQGVTRIKIKAECQK